MQQCCYFVLSKHMALLATQTVGCCHRKAMMHSLCFVFRTAVNTKNVYRTSCKLPDIFHPKNLNFLHTFQSGSPIPNFTKLGPVGAQLSRVDRRTVRRT